MQQITAHNPEVFFDFVDSKINRSDYRFKFLIPALVMIFAGAEPVKENTSIFKDGNFWVIYIEIQGHLFIYGDFTNQIIEELSRIMLFDNIKGCEIMGELNLVYTVLKKKNIKKYSVIKDRIFYSLNSIEKLSPSLMNTQATLEDLDELTQMMLEYHIEEYKGERNKTVEEIKPTIKKIIHSESIHIVKENNIIKAFCTINNSDVGIIYVKPEFRSQQIGKKLLSTCSRKLFLQNDICFLMTDLNNKASNKMCIDIGYQEIYRHTNIKL